MRPTRRQLLAGVGITAMAGGAFGTAAFTQVEADRVFDIELAGDDDAQLTLEIGDNESDAVSIDQEADGVIEFATTDLNDQADTVFEDVVSITNDNPVTDPEEDTDEDSIFVYVPAIRDGDDDPIAADQQQAIEFLVDDGEEALDISLPPTFGEDDALTEEARAFEKVTTTGAIELQFEESVQLTIRVLDFVGEEGYAASFTLPIAAQLDEPDADDWEVTFDD